MNAPDCAHGSASERPCRNDGCIVFDEHFILCAEHAREEIATRRKMGVSRQGLITPTFGARALIKPKIDICVISRDKDPIARGRIIIPESAKDRFGRIKGEDVFATGFILAVGPGYQARRGVSGAFLDGRQAPHARPGMRALFRAKYEQAIIMWRGLALVHDFDVLTEFVEEAA